MPCDRWEAMLVDRLADELSEADAILLEQHLAECAGCREEDRRLRALVEAALPEAPFWPSPALEKSLLAAMSPPRARSSPDSPARARPAERWLRFLRRPIPAYVAAALVAAAVLAGIWAGHREVEPAEAIRAARPAHHEQLPPLERSALAFATTPKDAVSIARASGNDSL